MTVDGQEIAKRVWERLTSAPALDAPTPSDDRHRDLPSVIEWAEDRFYIAQTGRPIQLQPVQRAVLEEFTRRDEGGRFVWQNLLYSSIKKSGKTTIAAAYQRWAAECWGPYGEVYHLGNKLAQAKERAFKMTRESILLAPKQERAAWDVQVLRLTFENESFIAPLPVSAAGEAGGNQRITTWTELHGYTHEDEIRFFAELQPVPTQFYSQRFLESYAGYIGESTLLKMWWDMGLMGERLHDEYPLYGNVEAGLCAYIDQGEEARRMPWQQGEEGRKYYALAATTELPHEYERLHENRWVENASVLIPLPLWDGNRAIIEDAKPGEVVVIGADGSVSGDCTALVAVAVPRGDDMQARVLGVAIWEPSRGQPLDYDETIKPMIELLLKKWEVAEVAYDPYQLHDMMTVFAKGHRRTLFYAFSQGGERLEADTMLVKRIREGQVIHDGDEGLRRHIANADGKRSGDDKKLRIVKRDQNKKIDAAVALSMAVHRAFELGQKPKGVLLA